MKLDLAKVIGHRGACGYVPENTIVSVSKAHELGVKWVEFDVMLARCGEAIIIHDHTLDRTTNGKGHVCEVDYQTMIELDCGSWFSKEFAGEKIPTLKQILSHLAELNLCINVEIKPCDGFDYETTHRTLEILNSHWPAGTPVLISSFSQKVLEVASEFHFPLGYVINNWDSPWEEVLDKYRCVSLHVEHSILNPEKITQIKAKEKYVLAFTVNDKNRADQLFNWGVDSVFSDYPDKILSAD